MPINVEQIKQRITEILETIDELSLNEKYAIRYHVIVLAEALGNLCFQIAVEELNRAPESYSQCFKMLEEDRYAVNL
jgi:uncharacterized protein YutE (UPF0331/DUF86 family)